MEILSKEMMILALDVHYKETYAKAVGVLFNWEDTKPQKVFSKNIAQVEEYISGQFYKRELPCILELLKQIDLEKVECIIVDGHVYVNNDKTLGLGGHLYHSLKEKFPVIGVAKNSFINTEKVSFPIYRGESTQSLFVSTIGTDIDEMSKRIQNMKGNYRIPTILKELDRITKED